MPGIPSTQPSRQNGSVRTQAEDRFHKPGRRVDDVLTIVENKEDRLVPDGASDGLGGDFIAAQIQAEDAHQRRWHKAWIGLRGKLDKPDIAIERKAHAAGNV